VLEISEADTAPIPVTDTIWVDDAGAWSIAFRAKGSCVEAALGGAEELIYTVSEVLADIMSFNSAEIE